MKANVSNPRPRATLAPFVGVALAALTIGSLVTFSLVAQRASLEGFSARGVTAQAPAASSPESIVVPAGAAAPAPSSETDAPTSAPAPSATTLLVSLPDIEETGAPAASPTTISGRDPEAPRDEPSARLPIGPVAASLSDDGPSRADEAHDAQKPKKSATNERPTGSSEDGNGHGRPEHAGPPPAKSKSKPAHAPKQQHTPVANGHVKARGQGHHKDRGRGHDKD